jgi:hypothetical protein
MKALESARNEALAAHELARARMKARSPETFRTFQKGDKVWLEAKNLRLPYLSKKMSPKRTGPFVISQVLSPVTYRLLLPSGWKIHDVFHSSLLTPFRETDTHGPAYPTPIPDIIEGEEEFEVEGILKHKVRQGKAHFLIRWKNCLPSEDSWEPEDNLTHAKDILREYWARTVEHNKRKTRTKKISPSANTRKAPKRTHILPQQSPLQTRVHQLTRNPRSTPNISHLLSTRTMKRLPKQ